MKDKYQQQQIQQNTSTPNTTKHQNISTTEHQNNTKIFRDTSKLETIQLNN